MRVPLQVPAEGMEGHDGTELYPVGIVLIGIAGLFLLSRGPVGRFMLFLLAPEFPVIEEAGDRVPGGDEKDIEKFSVLLKEEDDLTGDGEDEMAVRAIDDHRGYKSGSFLAGPDSTGGT